MKRLFIFGMCILAVMCLVSCYPEGPDYVHEKDIALTHYDEKADFSAYKTFVIPDSVVIIQADRDSSMINQEFKKNIIALVKENFEACHYRFLTAEEAAHETPDFVVTISAFASPTFNFASWGDYWGWYPGWGWFGWGSPWGGYYPWYPWYGGYTYYAYDKGTLVIDMLDPRKADEDSKRIPVMWTGVINGILAGSQAYLDERVEKNVDQCFMQSPYLKTTK